MSKPVVRNSAIFEALPEERLRIARARSSTRQRALDEAREEAKKLAYADGFDLGQVAGYSEGFETGRREAVSKFGSDLSETLADIRMELEKALMRLGMAVEHFYVDAEIQLASVASDVVRRVLDGELRLNEEAIIGIARAAINEVAQSREVTVRVNVADCRILLEHKAAIMRGFSGIKSLEFVEDDSFLGGCIVESSHGSVDATRATTLSRIEGEAA